jgi:hypothetical protein
MSKVIIISLFVIAGMALAAVSLLSRRESSRVPSLSDISAFVMDYRVGKVPVGRVAVLGFWWWAGWHFFAR